MEKFGLSLTITFTSVSYVICVLKRNDGYRKTIDAGPI
jgi:hypothetical protein